MFPHFLMMAVSFSSFDFDIPGWAMLIFGLCILTYQLLDNIDGKQARKTGNGTPLGLLFDHGCDSLTGGIFAVTWMKFFRLKMGVFSFMFLLSVDTAFATSTLEAYFAGGLFLGKFNAASDGNF
jgi:ethanolaminephosphotransferase